MTLRKYVCVVLKERLPAKSVQAVLCNWALLARGWHEASSNSRLSLSQALALLGATSTQSTCDAKSVTTGNSLRGFKISAELHLNKSVCKFISAKQLCISVLLYCGGQLCRNRVSKAHSTAAQTTFAHCQSFSLGLRSKRAKKTAACLQSSPWQSLLSKIWFHVSAEVGI